MPHSQDQVIQSSEGDATVSTARLQQIQFDSSRDSDRAGCCGGTPSEQRQQCDAAIASASVGPHTARGSELLQLLQHSLVGRTRCLPSPFAPSGYLRLTYADFTASGRPVSLIERYLQRHVLPTYANTHTTSSYCGLQTTRFREEARHILHRGMNGGEDDVVLFVGSGSTSGFRLLVHVLDAASRVRAFRSQYGSIVTPELGHPLVVLVGPYEHHSNLLPWREAGAFIIVVEEDEQRGGVSIADLEMKACAAQQANPNALLVGTFSAGSNISGILSDTVLIARTLHMYGFVACFDYAAAAPYVEIDANPIGADGEPDPLAAKDAVIFSPHKFVGGPGSAGVCMMKRRMFRNAAPNITGGGTVRFVTEESHAYLTNIEEREEGGTPDILGAIRAGLAWLLKERLGASLLHEREVALRQRGLFALFRLPNVVLIGHPRAERLPIFSFILRFPLKPDIYLHHGFVSALLNDLFGLQTRSGCMCAGPYGEQQLDIDEETAGRLYAAMIGGFEILKPGWTRFNLSFCATDAEVNFILSAIAFVSEHAWRFLPLYAMNPCSGEWKHAGARSAEDGLAWLRDWSCTESEAMEPGNDTRNGAGATNSEQGPFPHDDTRDDAVVFEETLALANRVLASLVPVPPHCEGVEKEAPGHEVHGPLPVPSGYAGIPDSVLHARLDASPTYADLRWFLDPAEALEWALNPKAAGLKHKPATSIHPRDYKRPAVDSCCRGRTHSCSHNTAVDSSASSRAGSRTGNVEQGSRRLTPTLSSASGTASEAVAAFSPHDDHCHRCAHVLHGSCFMHLADPQSIDSLSPMTPDSGRSGYQDSTLQLGSLRQPGPFLLPPLAASVLKSNPGSAGPHSCATTSAVVVPASPMLSPKPVDPSPVLRVAQVEDLTLPFVIIEGQESQPPPHNLEASKRPLVQREQEDEVSKSWFCC